MIEINDHKVVLERKNQKRENIESICGIIIGCGIISFLLITWLLENMRFIIFIFYSVAFTISLFYGILIFHHRKNFIIETDEIKIIRAHSNKVIKLVKRYNVKIIKIYFKKKLEKRHWMFKLETSKEKYSVDLAWCFEWRPSISHPKQDLIKQRAYNESMLFKEESLTIALFEFCNQYYPTSKEIVQ